MMTKIFQLALLYLMILYVKCDKYCYVKDDNPYKLFSTWTPPPLAWAHVEAQECKPIYVWSLLKHGIRTFTDEQIKRSKNTWKIRTDIEENCKEDFCDLCGEDYDIIRRITASFSADKTKADEELAKKALSAHDLFAAHLRQVMESAPAFSFSKTSIEIQTSEAKEAKDSAKQLASSFLKDTKVDDIITENKELLKTKSSCANWDVHNKEADKFIQTNAVEQMRLEVSARLGFIYGLPLETVLTMYESCVFWNLLPQLFGPGYCAAFSPDQLKVLEYWQDLKHYYEFGYDNKLSEKMGCPLVKDMMEKLKTAASSTWEEKQGTSTITHSTGKRVNINVADEENLMGMITKMGLYRDEKAAISHRNYNLLKNERKWRSSLLSPFHGSVHAILYNCNNDQKMVKFYLNQEVVRFDACKSYQHGKCPLNIFLTEVLKKNFAVDTCEKDYCGSFPAKSSGSGSSNGNIISYSFLVMIVCFMFNRLHNTFQGP